MVEHHKHHVASSPYLELQNPFTVWELFKLIILSPFAIIRAILIIFVLLVFAAISSLASLGAAQDEPFPPWRRRIVLISRVLGRFVLALLGFWVNVKGWKNYIDAHKQGTRLLVFNHPSWVDTIMLLYLFAPSGISREANLKIPIVGSIINSFQNIYVPAHQHRPAPQGTAGEPLVHKSTTELIAERLDDARWPIIAVAPEGMTSNGKSLLHFRSGAFVHAAPVLPVCISYSWHCLNPAWTIGNEPWHLVRMFTQFINIANVEILPAYAPSLSEGQNPNLFANNVRQKMCEALNVRPVECGISEYHKLVKMGINVNMCGSLVAPQGIIDGDGCVTMKITPSSTRRHSLPV